jgi:hypothetical protein
MSSTEDDIEEDMCTCGRYLSMTHGMCTICTDNWIEEHFISQQIEEGGYLAGTELGIETGIRHTIYKEARDDYWILDDFDIPRYAYIDRRSYERGFDRGFTKGYNSVYCLHQPVINHLQYIHKMAHFKMWVFKRYENHPLLECQIVKMIEQFVPKEYEHNNQE